MEIRHGEFLIVQSKVGTNINKKSYDIYIFHNHPTPRDYREANERWFFCSQNDDKSPRECRKCGEAFIEDVDAIIKEEGEK